MRIGLIIAFILALAGLAHAESPSFAVKSGQAARDEMLKRQADEEAARKKAEREATRRLAFYSGDRERQLCSGANHSRDILRKLPPPRDQGHLGWCYAMVAADLASFVTGHNISAADMAITYGANDSPSMTLNPFELACRHRTEIGSGGFTEDAFNLTAEKGFCRESELPTKPLASGSESRLDRFVEGSDQPLCSTWVAEIRALLGSRSMAEAMKTTADAVKATLKSMKVKRLEAYANRRCQHRELTSATVKSLYADEKMPATRRLAVEQTLESLSAGRPAGVGLDIASLLKPNCNPDLFGYMKKEAFDYKKSACDLYNDAPGPDASAPHEMMAVGAKWTGRSCEVQLRNSWGGDCRCFKPEVHCTADFISVPTRNLEKLISNVDLLSTH